MIVLAAALAALAASLAWPTTRRLRGAARQPDLGRLLPALLAGIGLAAAGPVGAGIGLVAAVLVRRRLRGAQARAAEEHRRDEERELPAVASLLAALLSAGSTIEAAVHAIAGSGRGALAPALMRVDAAMALGAAPEQAWAAGSATLAPIAEALRRSANSGAPAADLLADAAVEAQRARRARAEIAARSAGVRAVLPLVACFLPAFLLVGVVPVIVSVAGSLLR